MIGILIVAGIRLYRKGLVQLLSRQDGISIVGALPDARDAQANLKRLAPDVVWLDMATAESYATARELRIVAQSASLPGCCRASRRCVAVAHAGRTS